MSSPSESAAGKPAVDKFGWLVDFVNEQSKTISAEKAAFLALFEGGLIASNTDVLLEANETTPDDGEPKTISFAQLYGRLEGAEKVINALVARAVISSAETLGQLELPLPD